MGTAIHPRSNALGVVFVGFVLLAFADAAEPRPPGAWPNGPAPVPVETREAGRELFARAWKVNDPRSHGGDGLGPVFNARSCVDCHDLGGPGGAGGGERNIDIATVTGAFSPGYGFAYTFGMNFGAGGFSYQFVSDPPPSSRREPPIDLAAAASIHPGFRAARSVVLHRYGTDPGYNVWRESAPGPHGSILVRISQRNPTPLFGTGLIDSIPNEVIEEAAKRKTGGSTAVKGRVSRMKDGRIGRFGWKAQTATLEEFVLSAAATEIGLEVPGHHQAADPRLPGLGAPGLDMDRNESVALVAYVRSLPAPVVREPADAQEEAHIKAGESTFKSIGCTACHLPKLGDVEGLYSDLLLHDMGTRLGDTSGYDLFISPPAGANGPAPGGGPRGEAAGATLSEWRTPPLWALRETAPYLHDGRAANVDQAIAMHAGQGQASARRYAQLTTRRKQQLEAFLLSLSAPPQEEERPAQAKAP